MKRIYLFVLTALMMLMSTSAMAQSETIKGDVNGDGVVDVADIAAVIKIMTENGSIEKKYYWYAGQTAPTVDNYTTLATQVTNYPSTYEYQNTSGKRGYAYVILHNSKTLTAVEKVSQATVNFTTDTTSISNYTIYKSTVGMAINGVMVITIK